MPAVGNENELVAALGYPAFKRLVAAFAGRRIRVPALVDRADSIVQVLGRDIAVLMVEHFGGFDIEVPNGRPHVLPSREAIIKELIGRGWTNDDIIDNIGCTERTVRRYRAEVQADDQRASGLANPLVRRQRA